MVERLPYPNEKENPHPRQDLDDALEVSLWKTPTKKHSLYEETVPRGAPSWWHGDEEATQTFLRGMGVQSLEELRR